jgi:transcriptional accessory protein Tex/SPT6
MYKLVAIPSLLTEGDFKGHLETVTFVVTSESESHKWWSVNAGTYETDFAKIVSPELSRDIVSRLREGETVEFPNRYELQQVESGFGGSFRD